VFVIVSSPATDDELGPNHIRLIQNADAQTAKTVAVVDRTADLGRAAESLLPAILGFGGRSLYTPDVILVNEYVKQPFLQAVEQNALLSKNQKCDVSGGKTTNLISDLGKVKIVEIQDLYALIVGTF
jgi:hypothetical protein